MGEKKGKAEAKESEWKRGREGETRVKEGEKTDRREVEKVSEGEKEGEREKERESGKTEGEREPIET